MTKKQKDARLRWMSAKYSKAENTKAFIEDFRNEINIDPFIDELAPDPLIDELNLSKPLIRHSRGDYLPPEIWSSIIPNQPTKAQI